jgi:hypothetical protein
MEKYITDASIEALKVFAANDIHEYYNAMGERKKINHSDFASNYLYGIKATATGDTDKDYITLRAAVAEAIASDHKTLIIEGTWNLARDILINGKLHLIITKGANLTMAAGNSSTFDYTEEWNAGQVRHYMFRCVSDDVTIEHHGEITMNYVNASQYRVAFGFLGGASTARGTKIKHCHFIGTGIIHNTFEGVEVDNVEYCTFRGVHVDEASVVNTNCALNITQSRYVIFSDISAIGYLEAVDIQVEVYHITGSNVVGIDCSEGCLEVNNGVNIQISGVVSHNCVEGVKVYDYPTGTPAQSKNVEVNGALVYYDDDFDLDNASRLPLSIIGGNNITIKGQIYINQTIASASAKINVPILVDDCESSHIEVDLFCAEDTLINNSIARYTPIQNATTASQHYLLLNCAYPTAVDTSFVEISGNATKTLINVVVDGIIHSKTGSGTQPLKRNKGTIRFRGHLVGYEDQGIDADNNVYFESAYYSDTRLSDAATGQRMYDTTLNKWIYNNGSGWRDMNGGDL